MSPWTVIGWVLVVVIVGPIIGRVLIGLCELTSALAGDLKKSRRLRRAHKGKVTCDYRACPSVATRRGPRGFVCEEHIGTYVTSKTLGIGSRVSYAQRLDHAKGDK